MKKFLVSSWEVIEVALIAFVAVFLIRSFLVQPFLVNGASMDPTFSDGNYLLIDVLSYRFREPQRGEVVVLRYPKNESIFFIKRIIGLPHERVVVRDGKVAVYTPGNSFSATISEKYLPQRLPTGGDDDITLEDNQFFVMGDNRGFSFDSRNWGPVSRQEIVGLVRLRVLPITEAQAFEAPSYSF